MKTSRCIAVSFVFLIQMWVSSAFAKTVTLEEGTLVMVTNTNLIQAAHLDEGALVTFVVAEDVKVNDSVVIKNGTPVKGKVMSVSKEARMGMQGMLMINLETTKAIDGQQLEIVGKAGKGLSVGEAVDSGMKMGCLMSICPLFMFQKGDAADIPANSVFRSRTKQSMKIETN
jgi:hypothetical protein